MSDPEQTSERLGSGAMFDAIAARYDVMNRVMSFGIDKDWRRRAVLELGLDAPLERGRQEPARVLDLATGTGDLAIAIARAHPAASVVGVDPSRGMLAVGTKKVEAE